MNCCNANGECTGGPDCPVRPAKVAPIARRKPTRIYTCDQLGVCHCQGDTGCVSSPPPSPQMPLKERFFTGAIAVTTLGALAGVAGYVWGLHGGSIIRALHTMANRLG